LTVQSIGSTVMLKRAEKDWLKLRSDLDDLARAYNVAWNWSNPRYTPLEATTGGIAPFE